MNYKVSTFVIYSFISLYFLGEREKKDDLKTLLYTEGDTLLINLIVIEW